MRKGSLISLCTLIVIINLCVSTIASNKYCRVNTDKKVIAITFDDGPHPVYTSKILDILSEYGVKATFFVIGENAAAHPDLIERETAEGHEVENHTFDHEYLSKKSEEEVIKEIKGCEDVLGDIQMMKPRFLRPPGGICSSSLEDAAGDLSYEVVLWSVDTEDWKKPPASRIVSEVKRNAKCGDIILMHDYVSGRSSTPDALSTVIPYLLSEGYEFVTVSELVSLAECPGE